MVCSDGTEYSESTSSTTALDEELETAMQAMLDNQHAAKERRQRCKFLIKKLILIGVPIATLSIALVRFGKGDEAAIVTCVGVVYVFSLYS
eukprot:COSAG06_NODE_961_length_11312_cov_10.559351_8_plen_91_part_00